MSDVFISYAREDNTQAERIARGLEAQGLSVFWDNEIPPGQTWADYIEGKLNQCNVAVVLWSEHSTKSQWVREEARMGRGKLIPARLDASEAPFGFGDVQAADLSHWGCDYNHPEWGRFSRAVVTKVRGDAGPPPSPPATEPQAPPQPQASGWQTQPPLPHQSQPQTGGWQTPPPSPQQSWSANQSAQQSGVALTPIAYLQRCFRLFADGKGRAPRAEFWWWVLFTVVVIIVAAAIDLSFGVNPYTNLPNSQIASALAVLLLAGLSVAVTSRRLHDAGLSGWIAGVPAAGSLLGLAYGLAGIVFSLIGVVAVLVIGLLPGIAGVNQYGPDPKAP